LLNIFSLILGNSDKTFQAILHLLFGQFEFGDVFVRNDDTSLLIARNTRDLEIEPAFLI
jgi:hypothetical protein